ncbi:MAG: glycerol kinase GlpK [Alphaproteobacteria bacterium]|nr:glycerol kinase GlpK [Alphaproteobacteria bacterium]
MTRDIESGPFLIAIDQGTTSTRAVAFNVAGEAVATAQHSFPQIYPRDGWVEHDADTIWKTVQTCMKSVLSDIDGPGNVAAIGITNQRETTVVWDRSTGKPVCNAIVWQDRRGAAVCRTLAESGYGTIIQERTGLMPDSYFSATKLQWILESDPAIRDKAKRGELAFGTIDTFLLWRLTGGAAHATDATNASRTMLFNIHTQSWDEDLLDRFDVPAVMLPAVRDTASNYGKTDRSLFGVEIPITALVGDQQGALVGQACFKPGMAKATFGTGAFVLLNTGASAPSSQNKLLTTVGYRVDGAPAYAIEGSVFNAGTVVQWLRDQAGFIATAEESAALARQAKESAVMFVPAFTGLGAPHWDPDARGAILGITRDTTPAEIVRAGLEAVCFQTKELLDAMAADTGQPIEVLGVDGGMAANDWLLQTLADLLGIPVERPTNLESTVHGAALMAGLGVGIYGTLNELSAGRTTERLFEPSRSADWRDTSFKSWQSAVARVRQQ